MITKKNNCMVCDSRSCSEDLALKDQFVSHHYTREKKYSRYRQDMVIGQCINCGLVQLLNPFPVDELVPHYDWITCTEPERHLDDLVNKLSNLPGINNNSNILGLTFKEKTTLDRFNGVGFSNTRVLNPKHDFNILNKNSNIELVQYLFNTELAKQIVEKYGKADIFIARHILEHAYNLKEFIRASIEVVRDDGYIVFEIPDCETGLKNGDPTILWEEHTLCFTEFTFKNLLSSLGYQVVLFDRITYKYEDSFVAIVKKKLTNCPFITKSDDAQLKSEITSFSKYITAFVKNKNQIAQTLLDMKSNNRTIGVIGAGHMANSFVNYFDIGNNIDYIIDDNPNMNGLYMPKCQKMIVSSDVIKDGRVDILLSTISEQGEEKIKSKYGEYLDHVEFMSIYSQDPNSIYAIANNRLV